MLAPQLYANQGEMFDNGAVMSFGAGAGNGLQNSFLASCRNQVAPQALGNKNRRATYDSGLNEQQFESSIAQLWNNSPSFNSVEVRLLSIAFLLTSARFQDIWKFSPANGTAEVAGSQTSSSSPDEQHDAIFSLASQVRFAPFSPSFFRSSFLSPACTRETPGAR